MTEQENQDTQPEVEQVTPPQAEEKEDFYDKYLRLAADFDNFRKRIHKEKTDYLKYANENLVRDLLPIIDNFERALEHGQNIQENDDNSVVKGVQMILSQLQTTLERFGVKSRTSVGEKFDPTLHEAVSYIPSADHDPNTIIAEHQKAYFLHDRLIRPALVTVAAEKKSED